VTEYSVELRNVSKRFSSGRGAETVDAVREANLAIRRGEFFTLLGPSGCGKTTTLRLIAGFEQPTSGEIFIDGRAMSRVPPNRRPVNTVFQNYALFPHMNVARTSASG
jgi:spermidine/putrescine transport system ATP-binding protein